MRAVFFFVATLCMLTSIHAQDSLHVYTVGNVNLQGYSWDVAVSGHYAFVAGATPSGSGFSIVDIQRPDSMTVAGVFDPHPEEGGSDPHVAISGNYAYVKDEYGMIRVADISNLGSPHQTDSLWWNGEIGNLIVSNNYLFVPTMIFGLRILSLADPAAPVDTAAVDPENAVLAIAISGNLLCAVEYNGVLFVDVTNPAAPQIVGSMTDSMAVYYGVAAFEGTRAYAMAWSQQSGGIDLQVINVLNPAHPFLMGAMSMMQEPYGLVSSDSVVYVTGSEDVMRVINVSAPSNPVQVGYYQPWNNATYGMATADGNVLLAERDGIRVLHYGTPQTAEHEGQVAHEFALHPPYPNPFNSSTRIGFTLPRQQRIVLSLYDVLGRKVRDITNDVYPAGRNEILFQPAGLPSGMYWIHLMPPTSEGTQKIVIIK